jgi:hypothetical protein
MVGVGWGGVVAVGRIIGNGDGATVTGSGLVGYRATLIGVGELIGGLSIGTVGDF